MAKTKKTRSQQKSKMGRPTTYRKEYCDSLIKYFNKFLEAIEKPEDLKNPPVMPFLTRWARENNIPYDTMEGWAHDTHDNGELKNPDFSQAYKKAKEIQKEVLIAGGLNGKFNPTAFIFTAKNLTDMRDQIDTTVTKRIQIDI